MADVEAAHEDSPIVHTHAMTGWITGAITGALIGAALLVGGVVTVASGGVGVVAAIALVVGAAAAGAALGALVGSLFGAGIEGYVKRGASTVFYGPPELPAARVGDPVRMCHEDLPIAEGKWHVHIEGYEAACRKHKIQCDGEIVQGWTTIVIGGPTFQLYTDDERAEVDPAAAETLELLDLAFGFKGLKKGVDVAWHVAGFVIPRGLKATLGSKHPLTMAAEMFFAIRSLKNAEETVDRVKEIVKLTTTTGTSGKGTYEEFIAKQEGRPVGVSDTEANARRRAIKGQRGLRPRRGPITWATDTVSGR